MLKKVIVLFAFSLFVGGITAQTSNNLYFVFLNTNPDREALGEDEAAGLQAAHIQNIDRLAEEGKLSAAGPFEGGGGMFILNAESLEQAKSFLSTDPAYQANSFVTEIFPLQVAHGRVCRTGKSAEMVTYQLVRFTKATEKSDKLAELSYDNRTFMYTLSTREPKLLLQGYFGNQLDGIAILETEDAGEAAKAFKKHPGVRSGDLTYETKTLWIARGTFCE